ncbi:MAG: hypothetical protein QXQ40_00630 [Candidatus Aenigmatarchaeota archaeon]
MKAQAFEMLGFVILAVAILVVTLMLRTASIKGYAYTTKSLFETQEGESFRAGVNAILHMTEERTGKSMIELIGIAAYIGNDTINFGPVIGKINVTKELEWRFNVLYGEGHWYIYIPLTKPEREIQIVIVSDTSGSLCDDVLALKNITYVLEGLRQVGREVSMTLYLLEGQLSGCCEGTITCGDFPSTQYFSCDVISRANCSLGGVQTEEDWGNGLACAIENGPKEGWLDYSVKVGMPLSDELPGGSETCTMSTGSFQYRSLQNGIRAAKERDVIVFPLKAETGKDCCPSCNCPGTQDCGICFHNKWMFTRDQCICDDTLSWYMSEIANQTGGRMIALKDALEIINAIKNVVVEIEPKGIPFIEAGYKVPEGKNIRAVTVAMPTLTQKYVELQAKQWS